jgi:methyl-accepting chemotaxis protein
MNWFLDLRTRSKLLVGFGLMIAFLATVIASAYVEIKTIQRSEKNLYETHFGNALDLMTLRAHVNGVRMAVLQMMVVTQRADQDVLYQEVRERSQKIDHLMEQLLGRSGDDPRLGSQLAELQSLQATFTQTRDGQLIPLIYAGRHDEAQALLFGVQKERYDRIRALADTLGDVAEERARAAVAESGRRAGQALRMFVIIGLAAILLAVVMAQTFSRMIATPLRDVAGVAGRVADGDLTVGVQADRRADEVGDLMRAVRDMIARLQQMTADLHEGIGVLTSSSAEILATTTQVASGAAQTASAVSETSTTVEEVKQTAQLATQKARSVSDGAQRMAQVSLGGRQAVDDAIGGMQRVQEQMASIADSVVRLSEQSLAIGEIIATVNDLAEQSNLLAVNAAIEATKAGEHGKGFAVVAQEVKSLAEQSKQATAQVRAILTDIQKATSAAVLATEQGHRAVEAGVKQSTEAGDAIRQLTDSVNEAAQAATQIAASSQQQTVGMDQVALAMDNIRQASSQNVAGTRQAEAAAQQLHELGTRLGQLVEQYKV